MDKFVTFHFAIFNASSSKSSLTMSPKNLAFYKNFTINNVTCICKRCFFISWFGSLSGPRRPPWGSSISVRHTTLCRTPLIEELAHRRDVCLTTHDDYKGQTFMPPVGFELAILASERPQTHVLDRAATGTGFQYIALYIVSVPLKVIGFSFAPASQFHSPCCYYWL
jgi:hypothetical protein